MRQVYISIPKKGGETVWADDNNHKKTFGLSALGFWQWNVDIFASFDGSFSLKVPEKGKPPKGRQRKATITGNLTLLGPDGTGVSNCFYTIELVHSISGKDPNFKYTYRLVSSQIVYGTEKIKEFVGIKGTLSTTAKEITETNAYVSFFNPVPNRDTAEGEYDTMYTVREVFHLGERKEDKKDEEEKPVPPGIDITPGTTPPGTGGGGGNIGIA